MANPDVSAALPVRVSVDEVMGPAEWGRPVSVVVVGPPTPVVEVPVPTPPLTLEEVGAVTVAVTVVEPSAVAVSFAHSVAGVDEPSWFKIGADIMNGRYLKCG
jgi:hypothetical protein